MPEVRETKVQQIDQRCPFCGKCWMRPTGIVITGEPAQFEHSCNACGQKSMYTERYPYTVYSDNNH